MVRADEAAPLQAGAVGQPKPGAQGSRHTLRMVNVAA